MESWAAKSVEERLVSDLIPYERNPKVHPASQIAELARSINEWGWTVPILIDDKGKVLAGHGRLYAAQEIGIEKVPCVIAAGWSEQQKKAYVIADNKLSENGAWDDSLFFSELRALSDEGFDLSLVGMDADFSFDDFEPNFEPTMINQTITPNDLQKAAAGIAQQIHGQQTDHAKEGLEVMCPNCAYEFVVSGY